MFVAPVRLKPVDSTPCLFAISEVHSSDGTPSYISSPGPTREVAGTQIYFSHTGISAASKRETTKVTEVTESMSNASFTSTGRKVPYASTSLKFVTQDSPQCPPLVEFFEVTPPNLYALFSTPAAAVLSKQDG